MRGEEVERNLTSPALPLLDSGSHINDKRQPRKTPKMFCVGWKRWLGCRLARMVINKKQAQAMPDITGTSVRQASKSVPRLSAIENATAQRQ
jgi:hypothetical protein